MGSLRDQLSLDIVDNVLRFTDDRDLFSLGCTAHSWRSLVAPVLEKRISESCHDGMRVLITLENRTPGTGDVPGREEEMSLLGLFESVDPNTLDLKLKVEPLDKDGFNSIKGSNAFMLYPLMAENTRFEMEVFMAKISTEQQRIKYVHPLGQVELDYHAQSQQQVAKLNEAFRVHYHLREPSAAEIELTSDEQVLVLEVNHIQVSAGWWIYQIENNYSQTW